MTSTEKSKYRDPGDDESFEGWRDVVAHSDPWTLILEVLAGASGLD